MSEHGFEHHTHAAVKSIAAQQLSYPVLHVDPPFCIPADTRAALGSDIACDFAARLVCMALEEDGPDLTSLGIFSTGELASVRIVAKKESIVVGLPLVSLVLYLVGMDPMDWSAHVEDGAVVHSGAEVASIHGHLIQLLKAERIILNLISHLSGVGNMVRMYRERLEGTGVRLLDTRKTLSGQRYLEKYAVRVAGGCNHRINLADMLLVKDNHIDAAGSITKAVEALRHRYSPCPPIEIECRNVAEVKEAVACAPERILLDNMDVPQLARVLPLIPRQIEAEISGGVTLESIRSLAMASAQRPADFISVGRLTHSAPAADFSMKIDRGVQR